MFSQVFIGAEYRSSPRRKEVIGMAKKKAKKAAKKKKKAAKKK